MVLAIGLVVDLLKPASFATLACLLLIPTRHFGSIRTTWSFWDYTAVALQWFGRHGTNPIWTWTWRDGLCRRCRQRLFKRCASLENPMSFIGPFARLVRHELSDQWLFLYCYVGGWIPWGLFLKLKWLSYVSLVGIGFSSNWREDIDKPWALGMFLQALVSLVVIAFAMWLRFAALDPSRIIYLNGRYLFSVVGCLGICFAELFHRGFARIRSAMYGFALLANLAASIAILLSIGLRVWG